MLLTCMPHRWFGQLGVSYAGIFSLQNILQALFGPAGSKTGAGRLRAHLDLQSVLDECLGESQKDMNARENIDHTKAAREQLQENMDLLLCETWKPID